ncbi:MAG: flagellar protein FlgN [Jatrophihabitans sp.]|nr:MAG: flagellar protein FlgN [Jatrophihabitans sp.]
MPFSAMPAGSGTGPADPFPELADILWGERAILERLRQELVEQDPVRRPGRGRRPPHAPTQLQAAVTDLHTVEVLRAAEVEALVAHLGLSPDASLSELADAAPPPWPLLLTEHRAALRALLTELGARARVRQRSLAEFLR